MMAENEYEQLISRKEATIPIFQSFTKQSSVCKSLWTYSDDKWHVLIVQQSYHCSSKSNCSQWYLTALELQINYTLSIDTLSVGN